MPNWCSNRVDIVFTNEEMRKKFVEAMRLDDGEFNFNSLIPEPQWTKVPNENGELPTPKIHKWGSTLQWKDGSQDNRWYDWRLNNWGCKWTPSYVELTYNDGVNLQCVFDTPWGPPEEICKFLREEEYIENVSWFYDEPGMQFAGYL